MFNLIYKLYGYLFAKKCFIKLNTILFQLSIRGLGVLNYSNEHLTGEKGWLINYLTGEKNPIILDIGANIGNYSKLILKINSSAVIYAFEPHPVTFKKLIKNIQDLDIRAFNIGVGDNIGNMELYDYDINDGSSHASLYKSVITDLHKCNSVSHIVKIINIDKFLEKENINKVDLMKIDTEGNEYKVLIGAKSSIEAKKIKAIQFEFNEMNIVSKASFKDFWDILYNYKFYRLLPGGELLEIKKYNPLMTEIYGFQNIVAILKEMVKSFHTIPNSF